MLSAFTPVFMFHFATLFVPLSAVTDGGVGRGEVARLTKIILVFNDGINLSEVADKTCQQAATGSSILNFVRLAFPFRKNFQRFVAEQLFHGNFAA